MTSAPTPIPFIVKVTNHLPVIEKVLLTALAVGLILTVMKIDSAVPEIALLGLAITFFLFAYRTIEIRRYENEQFGFSEFLGYRIIPKILWISSSISALGISFYLFDFGNEGYKQMLMFGGSTIFLGSLVLLVLSVSGVKHLKIVTSVLLRAVPLLLVDMYLLFA